MKSSSRSLSRAQPWLGTLVEIRVRGTCEATLAAAVGDAFAAVAQVHTLMSFHSPNSDLARINRLAHQAAVTVHPWTYRVLQAAQEVSVASEGLFDCAIAPSLVDAGYLPTPVGSSPTEGTLADVSLQPGHQVKFARPLCLDLGGIAKGFAVDRAVEALQSFGLEGGVVNAGGDMRIFGAEAEAVYVRHPENPGALIHLGDFGDAAIATSAAYYQGKEQRGQWLTPVVRPNDRTLLSHRSSATVVAECCMIADALTKPLLLSRNPRHPCFSQFGAHARLIH
jgi:thiamine biosynthesis lipoprotein